MVRHYTIKIPHILYIVLYSSHDVISLVEDLEFSCIDLNLY